MAVKKKSGRDVKVTEGDGNLHRRGEGLGTGPVGTGGRGENNTGVDPEQAKAQAAAAEKAAKEKAAGVKPSGAGVRPSGQGAKPGQGQSAADDANDRGLLDDLVSISGMAGGQQQSQPQQSGGVDLSSLLGGGQQQQQQSSGLSGLASLLGGGQQQQQQSQQGSGLSGLADLLGGGQQQQQQSQQGSGLSGLADLLGGGQQQSQQQSQQGSGLSGLADLLGGGQQQQSQQQPQQGSGLSGLADLLGGGSQQQSSGGTGGSAGSGGSGGGTPVTNLFGGGSSGSSGSSGGGKKMSLLKLILFIVAAIIIISLLSKMCNSGTPQYGDDSQNLPVANDTSATPAQTQTQPAQTQPAQTETQTQQAESGSEAYTLPDETIPVDPDATYYSDDIQSILAALLSGSGSGSFTGISEAAGTTNTNPNPSTPVSTAYNTWDQESVNTNTLNTAVSTDPVVRAKYTKLKGNGQDQVTIMVYMCGTDLESKYGCGTKDMQEMLSARFGENVRILIYTGGCKKWNNKVMSNSVNQIYLIQNQQLYQLEKDMGQKSMVDPATLTEFIKYCAAKYPANRNMLIFWDHGGGSVSGYGYDEKYARSGSMSLAGVNTALANAGVQFDMVGFDACLMATAETALMLDKYCDYMVASEESEPGIGWYYTDWLTALGNNTSISTPELGKTIVDSFVNVCASKARGQSATLSVVDVAEFAGTVPTALANFSKSTTELIKNNNYQSVSKARSATREFAQSSRIDQIDLVDFLNKLGTDEAKALRQAVLGAVKYNKTSNDMTNCYGVSIFFPYRSARTVDAAVATYNKIGLGDDYSKCIQEFAAMECSGSAASFGNSGAGSLLDLLGGGQNTSSSYPSSGGISDLLGALLGGGDFSGAGLSGLDSGNTGFFTGRALTLDQTAEFIFEHQFDPGYLNWVEDGDDYVIRMPLDNWEMVTDIAMSMYYNDGEGYIDLGVDNVYEFDDHGNLLAPSAEEVTWLSIGGQGVAYYYLDSFSDGENFAVHGYVPAFLNGERVRLMLTFDNEHPAGTIAGAIPVYDLEETDQVAKNLTAEADDEAAEPFEVFDSEGEALDAFASDEELVALKEGDTLDFICDYYTYEGEYQDTFYLGDTITYTPDIEIANFVIETGRANMMYRFTDIYNQVYWSEALLN